MELPIRIPTLDTFFLFSWLSQQSVSHRGNEVDSYHTSSKELEQIPKIQKSVSFLRYLLIVLLYF